VKFPGTRAIPTLKRHKCRAPVAFPRLHESALRRLRLLDFPFSFMYDHCYIGRSPFFGVTV
jgi:hypothetical protein